MSGRAGNGSRLRLHPAARRPVHPGAWWLWAGGLAAVAMRTTNVVLLGLLLAVVAYVVAARRSSAPWSRSFSSFLKLGLVVVALRMLLTVLFGARLPGTVVFTIPIGVLSVGVVPRPTVPNTCSTSGTLRSSLSWTCSTRVASVIDMPGGDVGM